MTDTAELRPWTSLTPDEQAELRRDYQPELDQLPGTCSLDTKTERFAAWLAERGIAFSMADLTRRGKP